MPIILQYIEYIWVFFSIIVTISYFTFFLLYLQILVVLLTSRRYMQDTDYMWYLSCIDSLCGENSDNILCWFWMKRRRTRCRSQYRMTMWWSGNKSLFFGWTASITFRQTSVYIFTYGLPLPLVGLNIFLHHSERQIIE